MNLDFNIFRGDSITFWDGVSSVNICQVFAVTCLLTIHRILAIPILSSCYNGNMFIIQSAVDISKLNFYPNY